MATEELLRCITREAGEDFSAKQYRFVKQAADGSVVVCSSAGERSLGVAQGNPISGAALAIGIAGGISRIVYGEAIAIGDQLTTDAAGAAIVAVGDVAVLGEAMSAGSAGDIGSVMLQYVSAGSMLTKYVDVSITATELKALNATPKALVPAPGAGLSNVFDSAILFLDFGTVAYDGIAAGEDLAIKYTDAAGATLATVETTGFLDAGADAERFVRATTAAALTPVTNAAIVAHMLTGEIATGDSPLKMRVFYRTIPSSL